MPTSDNMVVKSSSMYVHSVSEACRLLPSSSQWNSIELDFHSSTSSVRNDNTPSIVYSKSYDYSLSVTDKSHLKRFICICVALVFIILTAVLLVHFLPLNHTHQVSSSHLTTPLKQALLFFDAQKSGILPRNNYSIEFRGDSGFQDGNFGDTHVDLTGGYYDSGNNIKFTFPTAYTTTLLSWTVIEYHQKYRDIGELEHVKSIIKWGSDYLLKVFAPPNSTSDPTILYSQVGSTSNDCWQRPEDMNSQRPISMCKTNSSDLAGEIIAALSATSLVFKGENRSYAMQLIRAAEKLFELVIRNPNKQGTYTTDDACGKEARQFYNSSGYLDEIVWGGTWLFFATGNASYLKYATDKFQLAMNAEEVEDGVFYWNNKLPASAVLLTRLRFFRDPGYPYEETLDLSTNMTDSIMCAYLASQRFTFTPGGLILLRPESSAPLQYAATSSFLTKLYSDYIKLTQSSGRHCSTDSFSVEMLQKFSISQVDYILGQNPQNMSYLVGHGDNFPTHIQHRGASIPWDDQQYTCAEGNRWLYSEDPNPNVLVGSMVGGPDQDDNFFDSRDKPEYTEPSISGNVGLVAALIALHDPPKRASGLKGFKGGIDQMGIFSNVKTG